MFSIFIPPVLHELRAAIAAFDVWDLLVLVLVAKKSQKIICQVLIYDPSEQSWKAK